MRQRLALLAPLALLLTLGALPMPASGDLVCPPGSNTQQYCQTRCVVPQLRGDTPDQARIDLEQHDCALGKVREGECRSHDHVSCPPVGTVLRSEPGAGTTHQAGKRVNIVVREASEQRRRERG